MSITAHLPDELLIRIFSFLPTSKSRNLAQVAAACQRFRRVSEDQEVWRAFLERIFSKPLKIGKNDPKKLVKLFFEKKLECFGSSFMRSLSLKHSTRISALSVHNHMLVAGDRNGQIMLWDLERDIRMREFPKMLDLLTLAFSPNGEFVAAGANCERLTLYKVETGKATSLARGGALHVHKVIFSPKGDWIAAGYSNGQIKLWDLSNSSCRQTLIGHQYATKTLAFSPDQRSLVSGSDDQTVRLWDLDKGECIRSLPVDNFIDTVLFTSQGILFAASNKLFLWHQDHLQSVEAEESFRGITLLSDQRALAITNRGFYTWDIRSEKRHEEKDSGLPIGQVESRKGMFVCSCEDEILIIGHPGESLFASAPSTSP